jgi:hypothetical protein
VNCHVAGLIGSDEDYGVCLDNRQVCAPTRSAQRAGLEPFSLGLAASSVLLLDARASR